MEKWATCRHFLPTECRLLPLTQLIGGGGGKFFHDRVETDVFCPSSVLSACIGFKQMPAVAFPKFRGFKGGDAQNSLDLDLDVTNCGRIEIDQRAPMAMDFSFLAWAMTRFF